MAEAAPLVTGIIIFLNGEAFIREAIESVLTQTYPGWELLLIDDGSTDRSTEIGLEYAKTYPDRVRYLNHDGHRNLGMSASRNLGIKAAKGTYIGFLDCDDIWLPHKLAEQVAIMESCPDVAMLYGRTKYWHSWTGKPEDQQRDSYTELGVQADRVHQPPGLVAMYLADENTLPGTCTALFRRDAVMRVGGFEDSFRDLYEDMVLWIKLAATAPAMAKDTCWAYYRQHKHSSCSVAGQTGAWDAYRPNRPRKMFLEWAARYLSEAGIRDRKVAEVLNAQLRPYRHPMAWRAARLLKERLLPLVDRVISAGKRRAHAALMHGCRRSEIRNRS
jgi:glycosyltransferase involved in cell wall biosynthesis